MPTTLDGWRSWVRTAPDSTILTNTNTGETSTLGIVMFPYNLAGVEDVNRACDVFAANLFLKNLKVS